MSYSVLEQNGQMGKYGRPQLSYAFLTGFCVYVADFTAQSKTESTLKANALDKQHSTKPTDRNHKRRNCMSPGAHRGTDTKFLDVNRASKKLPNKRLETNNSSVLDVLFLNRTSTSLHK